MPLAHRDGMALFYESTGAGAPVLLVVAAFLTS
jgi:hypothetical protein